MRKNERKIFIVAGDPSGDLHGSMLAKKIKEIQPQIQIFSAGGKKLAQESTQVIDLVEIAVTGIFEVITYLRKIIKNFNFVAKKIQELKPDIIILIDFPDFNLRLAKKLKPKGYKIFYYISPQVWAWRKRRVKLIKKYIDKMMVIFPFEDEFYKKEGISSSYVGHPLLEIINPHLKMEATKEGFQKVIAFLPGSRKKEVRRHLPLLLKVKKLLEKNNLRFIIIKHHQLPLNLFKEARKENIPLIEENTYSALSKSYLAITSSGTATLELALLEIPSIVIYKTGLFSWLFLKNMVKVDYISIINILAQEKIFPEFIQYKATPKNIASVSEKFIKDEKLYTQTKERLKKIRNILGEAQASLNAAKEIVKEP